MEASYTAGTCSKPLRDTVTLYPIPKSTALEEWHQEMLRNPESRKSNRQKQRWTPWLATETTDEKLRAEQSGAGTSKELLLSSVAKTRAENEAVLPPWHLPYLKRPPSIRVFIQGTPCLDTCNWKPDFVFKGSSMGNRKFSHNLQHGFAWPLLAIWFLSSEYEKLLNVPLACVAVL